MPCICTGTRTSSSALYIADVHSSMSTRSRVRVPVLVPYGLPSCGFKYCDLRWLCLFFYYENKQRWSAARVAGRGSIQYLVKNGTPMRYGPTSSIPPGIRPGQVPPEHTMVVAAGYGRWMQGLETKDFGYLGKYTSKRITSHTES